MIKKKKKDYRKYLMISVIALALIINGLALYVKNGSSLVALADNNLAAVYKTKKLSSATIMTNLNSISPVSRSVYVSKDRIVPDQTLGIFGVFSTDNSKMTEVKFSFNRSISYLGNIRLVSGVNIYAPKFINGQVVTFGDMDVRLNKNNWSTLTLKADVLANPNPNFKTVISSLLGKSIVAVDSDFYQINTTGLKNVLTNPIVLSPLPEYHPADLNRDFVISEGEINIYKEQFNQKKINLKQFLRAAQFYNLGGYKVQEGTEDGFAPI